jgi:hypothetical protein
MFQEFFNDMKNFPIQWVLTLAIVLWKIRSPSRLQFPKWAFTWMCECSLPHTFLHSQEHEMWLTNFPLDPHPRKPLLWSKPKVRVTTNRLNFTYPSISLPN